MENKEIIEKSVVEFKSRDCNRDWFATVGISGVVISNSYNSIYIGFKTMNKWLSKIEDSLMWAEPVLYLCSRFEKVTDMLERLDF